MSAFLHDPTLDDEGDSYTVHSRGGFTLTITPSHLSVYDAETADNPRVAYLPLDLGTILGVAANDAVHVTSLQGRHLTIVLREDNLDVCLRSPRHELAHVALELPHAA